MAYPEDLWPETMQNVALENRKAIMKRSRSLFALSACFLAASTSTIPAQPTETLSLAPLGFTGNHFALIAVGSGNALAMQLQVSSNLTDWVPLVSFTPFEGSSSFIDTNGPDLNTRFYRGVLFAPPKTIQYTGNSLVLVGYVPAGYGPDAVVHFIGGSGASAFNVQVTADAHGLYTLALNTSLLSASAGISMSVSSANGSVTSPALSLAIERSPGSNPALAMPVSFALDQYGSEDGVVEPDICTCEQCSSPVASSLMFFDNSFTPTDHGTELATGKLRLHFPVLSFQTQLLGFHFQLNHASLVNYAGPLGGGFLWRV